MLQVIRDRAQGLIVWIIVGLIIITFALFGLSSYLSGSAKSIVASVNGVEITRNEFINEYQNTQQALQQRLGENYDPRFFPEEEMKKRTLESMIQRELINQQLNDGGFNLSREEVLKVIGTIPAFLDESGKFSQEKYEQVLSYQRMNSEQFLAQLGHDLAVEQLQNGLIRTVLTTETQVENLQILQNQQRKIGYLILPVKTYLEKISITDDAIQQYYTENSQQFRTPERASFEYVELKLQDVASQFEVSEEEAKEHYQQYQSNYITQPEKRRVRHILIKVDDNTDDATARAKALAIIERLNKGEDFIEIAKAESSDSFSAKQGGDLGLNAKSDMDKVLAEVAFSLEEGSISEPVQTRFGYHVLRVDEIEAVKFIPFEQAKAQIIRDMQNEKADEKYHTLVTRLDNLSYERADSLESVAQDLGLELKISPLLSKHGGAGVFANPKVMAAAFSDDVMVQGRNSELVELSDTHVVVVRKKEHQAASVKPLESVKQIIIARLKNSQARQQAKDDAQVILDAIKDGKDPEQLASDYKQTWQTIAYISRTAEKGDKLDNSIRNEAFRLAHPQGDKPVLTSLQLANGDAAVLAVYEVKQGEVAEDQARLKAQQQQLNNIYAQAEFSAFMAFLESKATITRNLKNTEEEN